MKRVAYMNYKYCVAKQIPLLYRRIKDWVGIVLDVRPFSSPEALASIVPWNEEVAWRLAAEETSALVQCCITPCESPTSTRDVLTWLLVGRPTSGNFALDYIREYRHWSVTYPLLTQCLAYTSEYWTALAINAGELLSILPLLAFSSTTNIVKNRLARIVSEVRIKPRLESLINKIGRENISRTKVLMLAKRNKNGVAAALLTKKPLTMLIIRHLHNRPYVLSLLSQCTLEQKIDLSRHSVFVTTSSLQTSFISLFVGNDIRLWLYSTCSAIKCGVHETFDELLHHPLVKERIPYNALAAALVECDDLYFAQGLATLFPPEGLSAANDLGASTPLLQILAHGLHARRLLTAPMIRELKMCGHVVVLPQPMVH